MEVCGIILFLCKLGSSIQFLLGKSKIMYIHIILQVIKSARCIDAVPVPTILRFASSCYQSK
jgi:hypothetical protein